VLHPLVLKVLDKIIQELKAPRKSRYSYEEIAEKANTTPVTISRIANKERGSNISLDMAVKIWEGLGYQPETLLTDDHEQSIIDPRLAEKIAKILNGPLANFFNLVVNLLSNIEKPNAMVLAAIIGGLKAAWRKIETNN